MSLELNESLMEDLGELSIAENEMVFEMTTVGDNDPESDCSHSSWTFDVTVSAI